MKFLDWFLTIIAALLPLAWQALVAKYPNFPLGQNEFSAIIDWLIRLIFGAVVGYEVHKYYLTGVAKGQGKTYEKFIKGE